MRSRVFFEGWSKPLYLVCNSSPLNCLWVPKWILSPSDLLALQYCRNTPDGFSMFFILVRSFFPFLRTVDFFSGMPVATLHGKSVTRHTSVGMQKTSWPGARGVSQLLLPYPLALAVFSTALPTRGPRAAVTHMRRFAYCFSSRV